MRTNLLLSTSSRRGAARLSAIWVIAAVVFALLMAVLAFTSQDAASKKDAEVTTAQANESAAKDALDERIRAQRPVSSLLGFTPDALTTISDAEAAKKVLDDAKAAFPDMEGVETFEAAMPRMVTAYRAKLDALGQKDTRISEVQSQYEAERTSRSSAVSEKDSTIDDLQSQLSDITSQKDSEIARLEAANEQLSSQVRNLTEQVTAARDEQRVAERTADRSAKTLATERLKFNIERKDVIARAEKPDGEITAVDSGIELAYINLNASDRLTEGARFRVVSAALGADASKTKGLVEVTNVGPVVSEVRVLDVTDPLGQPLVSGDKLYNPLFEPKAQRDAVLVGTFSGIYNEEELRVLLNEIGINVQDEITNTTNFLITGGPVFVDEDGEALEEPRKVEDLTEFAEAQDKGVVVVPMRDVQQYFRR